MWTEDDNERVVNDTFGGDADLYLSGLHESRRKAIKWDNLVASATILPELHIEAHELIKQLLGYLPPSSLTIREEPFIRALINNYRSGGLTLDELFDQAEVHIKAIRNAELDTHTNLTYDRELYRKYFTCLPEVAEKVKERLAGFLGYEPALEHSLSAELHLQECVLDDTMYFSDKLNRADIQAITIIKYREVLFAKGKEAADASPLIAIDLVAEQHVRNPKKQRLKNVEK